MEDFLIACAAMGNAGDEDSVKAALAGIEAVYNRLSEEGKAAVADEWASVSSYRDQVNAGVPDAGIETMALTSGEKFTVNVVKVVNGISVETKSLTVTCLQMTGHSGYNHSTNLRALANQSGFTGYTGYNWSAYTTVPSSYTTGLCPNHNYTPVHYNLTGSAPYKANETLFLFFTVSKTFTLKYNANGGSGAPAQETATDSADSHRFTVSSTKPTRAGYDFLGWSTSSNAASAGYWAGSSIDVTGTTTLYAVWQKKANEKVTLTYDANGGINPPAAVTQDKESEFIIRNKGSMTRSGYDFLGWSAIRNATEADIMPGDTFTLYMDATLYAVWKKSGPQTAEAEYTVLWYTTDGDLIRSADIRTGTVGNSVAVTDEDKTVPGYVFDAGNPGNVTEATLAPSGTSLILYFYKPVTVTWVDEDGSTILDGPKSFLKGEAEPTTDVQPTKAEDEDFTYEFDKWERSEDADGNVTYRATYTATPKKPENPGTDPENPGTDPENPGTDPENPGTDPENPGTDPENPGTDPEVPGTDPENPGTDPENPGTDPENPGTDPVDPTPVDPTPVDPTPVDPTPAPAVTPTAPVIPAGPAPAPAAAPTAQTAPAEQLPEAEAPLAAPEAAPAAAAAQETLEEEDTPLAGLGRPAWALLNLILMLCTALASVLLLVGYLGKKKKELVDDNGRRVLDAEGSPVYKWIKKRHGGWRLFSLIPAVAALIAFVLTEDMRLPMVFTDRWTLLMVLIALVQLIVCFFAKKEKETPDNNQTPGGPAPAQA